MTSIQRGSNSSVVPVIVTIFSIIIISLLLLILFRQDSLSGLANLFKIGHSNKQPIELLGAIGDLQAQSTQVMLGLMSAEGADIPGSASMNTISSKLKRLIYHLEQSQDPNHQDYLAQLRKISSRMERTQQALRSGTEIKSNITQNAESLLALIPVMLAKNDELVSVLVSSGADSGTVYVATRQMMLLERMRSNIIVSLAFDANKSVTAADRYGRDASILLRIYQSLSSGSRSLRINKVKNKQARQIISELLQNQNKISQNIVAMLDRSPDYFQVQMALQDFILENAELTKLVSRIQQNEIIKLTD